MLQTAAGHVLRFRQPVAEGPACVVLVERSSVVGLESSGWSGDLSGDPSHCRRAAGRAPVLHSTALLPVSFCRVARSSRQRREVLVLGHLHGLGPAFL